MNMFACSYALSVVEYYVIPKNWKWKIAWQWSPLPGKILNSHVCVYICTRPNDSTFNILVVNGTLVEIVNWFNPYINLDQSNELYFKSLCPFLNDVRFWGVWTELSPLCSLFCLTIFTGVGMGGCLSKIWKSQIELNYWRNLDLDYSIWRSSHKV